MERAYSSVVWPIRKRRRAEATALNVKPWRWNGPAIVSFAFDDFPRTAWTVGGPILEAHGARGTYYASAGLTGRMHDGRACHELEDLEALVAAGHELACHTFEHVNAVRVSAQRFEASVWRNAAALRAIAGPEGPGNFAYTWGDVSAEAKRLCASKFRSARGTDWGLNADTIDLTQLRAVGLEVATGAHLDLENLLEETQRRNAWLILYTHDVAPDPSLWGCTPAYFDWVVGRVRAAGLPIATVDAALDRAGAAP